MNMQVDPHRRSGRTTRLALAYVNESINSPDRTITIRDHTGIHREAVRLTQMVKNILDVLGVTALANIKECQIRVVGTSK